MNSIKNVIICGDSFATIDKDQVLEEQWAHMLGNITLGRTGACTTYIKAQVKYAVEQLNADKLVIWSTTPDRFIFPITPIKPTTNTRPNFGPNGYMPEDWADELQSAGPILANTIETNLDAREINYEYPDYNPMWASDILLNFSVPSGPWNKRQKHLTEGQYKAFRAYLLYLSDPELLRTKRNNLMESIYYYCMKSKIETIIVDVWSNESDSTNPNWWDDVMDADNITIVDEFPNNVLNKDDYIFGIKSPSNHLLPEVHSRVAKYLQEI